MWKFLLCGLLLCSLSSLFGTNTTTGSEENLLPPEPNLKFTSFSRVFYDDNIFTAASGAAKDDSLFYSQTLKIAYKDDLIQAAATPDIVKQMVVDLYLVMLCLRNRLTLHQSFNLN